jgi:hypothetical protein
MATGDGAAADKAATWYIISAVHILTPCDALAAGMHDVQTQFETKFNREVSQHVTMTMTVRRMLKLCAA